MQVRRRRAKQNIGAQPIDADDHHAPNPRLRSIGQCATGNRGDTKGKAAQKQSLQHAIACTASPTAGYLRHVSDQCEIDEQSLELRLLDTLGGRFDTARPVFREMLLSRRMLILVATALIAHPLTMAATAPTPTAAPAVAPSDDPVVAKLKDITITRSQIVTPLIEGYGANVLVNVATLECAKQEAATRKLTVTPTDVENERSMTLKKLFGDAKPEDYSNLLDQFLQQQRISRPEFDIWLETNAYLRKIAVPMVTPGVTEDRLQEIFKARYGETVQVRHIECANLQEIAEAQRRIAAGEAFEHVAQTMSRDGRTAPLGGLMPPFSRYAGYPQVFKDVAFSLKPGEVSDSVQAEGTYHLIKLEKRIEPKAVKFEDVKQSLRDDLLDLMTQNAIKSLRQQLVDRIAAGLVVEDPQLAKLYEAKKEQADTAVHGKKDAIDAIKKDERRSADQTANTPLLPEDLRPPATMPGAAAPGASTMPSLVKPTTQP
jgi:hypothetical protein